jgi:hypothetical protein
MIMDGEKLAVLAIALGAFSLGLNVAVLLHKIFC